MGAGGNAGAVLAGFLFRMESLETSTALLILGLIVSVVSLLVFAVRFSPRAEVEQRQALGARTDGPVVGSAVQPTSHPSPAYGD